METIIRPVRVLIFLAICILTAPLSGSGRLTLMVARAFGQAPGTGGEPSDILDGLNIQKLSAMGRIAHLSVIGRLSGVKIVGGDSPDDNPDNDAVAGGHAQPSIAVDSTGQHIVIGSNDAEGFELNPISVSGVKYSDDGGQTFTDLGPLQDCLKRDQNENCTLSGTSRIGSTVYPGI